MDGLKQTNWMQDTILEEMQVGRTGNEVLASFDARMKAEGIDGKMYSHAIGDHGHAAGPTVGLAEMNNQPVPVKVRAAPPLSPERWRRQQQHRPLLACHGLTRNMCFRGSACLGLARIGWLAGRRGRAA